ncbi:MAG: DUF2975 domain-containing protein [Muribaculaceae bacterium]|nr:DUF2975 domain-containing protein [Muribaculaceae bacterium]
MNKTAIYVLSILIIIVLGLSVISPGIDMFESFRLGFKAGLDEAAAPGEQPIELPYTIKFNPSVNQVLHSKDSIEFGSGEVYPLVIHEASIRIPERTFPIWAAWVTSLIYVTTIVLLIVLICKFIKFIINISKEKIFVDVNAKYLKHFSYCLLTISLLQIVNGIIDEAVLSDMNLLLAGYQLTSNTIFPWGNLLIGLISLLISIIWSRAILIKQEQELTI